MNNKKNDRALFDAVSGIDPELIQEAAEPRVRPVPRRALRLAAIAAMVAILFLAAALLPIDSEKGSPYFNIYVYANETDRVELQEGDVLPVANGSFESANNNGLGIDNPYFSSTIFPARDPNSFFMFCVIPNESILSVAEDRYAVFCNGEQVDFDVIEWAKDPTAQYVHVARLRFPDPEAFNGYLVDGVVTEASVIEVVLFTEDGDVLQKNTVWISPVDNGFIIKLLNVYIADIA